jgi:predicted AlkP superfamily pyrophosphatase or phosphodiesterase
MNLSFDRKIMLVVRVISIYTIATSIFLINITLGLYVLSTILNESNVVLPNILLVKLLY